MQIVAIVVSLALTVGAVAMLVPAVRHMLGVIRSGQPASRGDRPVARTVTMLKETLLHTRMLQWTVVGVMHWFVFAAFIFLSTAVLGAYFQLFDPAWVWPVFGHWYPYEWFAEAIGLLSSVGIIYLIIYRQRHHPRTLDRQSRFFGSTQWQAYFVEYLALAEGGAILFIRGAEYNLGVAEGDETATRAHFPIASFLGDLLYPSSVAALESIIFFIAMFKIGLAMVWLMVIARNLTMGIAWHRFTAFFNIFYKRESDGSTALGAMKPLTNAGQAVTLDDIDDLDEDATLGVGQIEDFSWKGILDFTTCTECGRCQSQCPAWNTEKPLSPKLLITAMRDHAYAKNAGDEAHADRQLVGVGSKGESAGTGTDVLDYFYNPGDGDFVIDEDVLWSCTSCGACVQQCPVDIEHVDHIMDMRRYQLLVESNFPSELNQLFKGLENKGNPWNMSPNARMDWAKGLEFDVPVVGEDLESLESVDWLFWVGCAGAYEDRAKKTTRAVAELLDMAGVSFGVLGNGETCTGDPARRAGNEFVFQGLAQQNVETFKEHRVKQVVSTCAHCFNTLKNEYKDFGIELEVVHHTQLLNRLVREGRLTPVNDGAGAAKRSITYHDPCFLGRHNEVYSPPRELLQVLPGAEYAEMERHSEKSFCCGAGGARMWMEENIGERININRTKEAVGTGADQIAVGCPFCRVMLSDGLTMQQSKGEAREEVEVLDVAQMLLASVKGEQATKAAPGSSVAGAAGAGAAGATAKAGASGGDVATKDEPEAGDETVTEDTVTETPDVGPAAKASGGSSLFDTPADDSADRAEGADGADESAGAGAGSGTTQVESQGGSQGGSLFDTPADEPESTDSGSGGSSSEPAAGGSLFDLGGDEPSKTKAAQPEEAKAEPETAAQPASAAEPADSTTTGEESSPADDLGGGGSLFDLGGGDAAEPEQAAESQAAPVETHSVEDAGEPDQPIDRDADAADDTDPDAEKAAAESESQAAPEPEAKTEVDAEPEAATEAPSEAPASSGAATTPATEIPEGGSLFNIAAPEPTPASTPAPAEASEPVETDSVEHAGEPGQPIDRDADAADDTDPDAEKAAAESESQAAAEPEPTSSHDSAPGLEGGAALSQAATVAASDDDTPPVAESRPADAPDQGDEAQADDRADEAPADDQADEDAEDQEEGAQEATESSAPAPTSSGASHAPRTDADIEESGSLFDL